MSEKYEYEKITDPELLAQLNQGRESSSNGKEISSLGHSYKDYLQGLGSQLLQSSSQAGYHLGMAPSYGYESLTGHPLYSLVKPADFNKYTPNSEAGQTGKHVGETVRDIASLILPGKLAQKGLKALSQYHPLTKGQMGRQIQSPINAAEEAGIKVQLSPKEIYELDQLLGHPGLEKGGATGKALTPLGRHAIIEGATKGRPSAIHSAQANLGHLERAIPGLGESELASTRVRPLKDVLLKSLDKAMREGGLEEDADKFQQARQGSRRHYQTRSAIKNGVKTLSFGALLKMALSGAKNLP